MTIGAATLDGYIHKPYTGDLSLKDNNECILLSPNNEFVVIQSA